MIEAEKTINLASNINIDIIHRLFSPLGEVNKIMVFMKEKRLVKFFVEFDSTENAKFAKDFFDNSSFNGLGKIKLFFSSKQRVDIFSKGNEGRDYQTEEKKAQVKLINKIKKEISEINSNQKITVIKRRFSKEKISEKSSQSISIDLKSNRNIEKGKTIQRIGLKTEDTITKINESINAETEKPMTENPKVILISNLEEFFVNVNQIFNVFSCFGNITKVLLMKNLKKALIEFKKHESAKASVKYMNKKSFGETKIKVSFSNYKKLDLKRNNKNYISKNFNEVMVVFSHLDRFKNKSLKIIPPSHTLIAVIEKNKNFQLVDVVLAIKAFAKPIRIKSLDESNENQSIAFHQVLLKFPTVLEATKVLAQAHNTQIEGCLLNLTFAENSI